MFHPQPISSTDARKHFTNLIKKVSFSSKSFVVQSYRQSLVRIVNENYIRTLEDVIGKKTVNQVMQIAGDERLFESEKIEQIKKVFQRRLSGPPQQQPKPQLQQKSKTVAMGPRPATPKPQTRPQTQKPATVAATHASPATPKPPTPQTPKPKPPNRKQGKRVLLLSNGKNYQ